MVLLNCFQGTVETQRTDGWTQVGKEGGMNSCPVSTCYLPVINKKNKKTQINKKRMSTSHQHWLLERDRNKPLSRAMVSVRRSESEPTRSQKASSLSHSLLFTGVSLSTDEEAEKQGK